MGIVECFWFCVGLVTLLASPKRRVDRVGCMGRLGGIMLKLEPVGPLDGVVEVKIGYASLFVHGLAANFQVQ